MYYEVTTNLALDGGIDGPEVSQPIELGTDNAILVQIAIVSGYVGSGSLVSTLEFSNDLDNWTDQSSYYQLTLSEAPSWGVLPSYQGADGRFRFARLRYLATSSANVVFNGSLYTYQQG
ncbi:MAG: hypothetical protein KC549_10120 [Myxococcales bacterium]|nr:hypothetical protein [Myxococcales bacterium]MCB9547983.1 hypothetical protein [Myxococcales bacterium]